MGEGQGASEEPEPFQEGEVIRLDDKVTGFDFDKTGRPNCIVRLVSDPPQQAYVVTFRVRSSR